MKILAETHIPYVKDYFGAYGDLILKPGRTITAKDVQDIDILLVRSITPINEKLLARSRVKFIGSVTAGADHIDTDFLKRSGIAWSIAAGFNAPPVANYIVSVIAALRSHATIAQARPKAAVIG